MLATIKWRKDYPKVNLCMGIDIVKPGKYKTACGKGYYECEKGEPEVLKLKRPLSIILNLEVQILSFSG